MNFQEMLIFKEINLRLRMTMKSITDKIGSDNQEREAKLGCIVVLKSY